MARAAGLGVTAVRLFLDRIDVAYESRPRFWSPAEIASATTAPCRIKPERIFTVPIKRQMEIDFPSGFADAISVVQASVPVGTIAGLEIYWRRGECDTGAGCAPLDAVLHESAGDASFGQTWILPLAPDARVNGDFSVREGGTTRIRCLFNSSSAVVAKMGGRWCLAAALPGEDVLGIESGLFVHKWWIGFRPNTPREEIDSLHSQLQARVISGAPGDEHETIEIPTNQLVGAAYALLTANPWVAAVRGARSRGPLRGGGR